MSKVYSIELGQDNEEKDNKTMARADQSVFLKPTTTKKIKNIEALLSVALHRSCYSRIRLAPSTYPGNHAKKVNI